jgi:hypothetical protein
VLDFYAALVGSCLPTFQDSLSVSCSRVLDCLTLEDGINSLSVNVGK